MPAGMERSEEGSDVRGGIIMNDEVKCRTENVLRSSFNAVTYMLVYVTSIYWLHLNW